MLAVLLMLEKDRWHWDTSTAQGDGAGEENTLPAALHWCFESYHPHSSWHRLLTAVCLTLASPGDLPGRLFSPGNHKSHTFFGDEISQLLWRKIRGKGCSILVAKQSPMVHNRDQRFSFQRQRLSFMDRHAEAQTSFRHLNDCQGITAI